MIDPFVAIEQLIERAQTRVDLHNAQPHNTEKQITLADTIEAQAAEWISAMMKITPEMEEAGNEAIAECVHATAGPGGEWPGTEIEEGAAKRVFTAMTNARKPK